MKTKSHQLHQGRWIRRSLGDALAFIRIIPLFVAASLACSAQTVTTFASFSGQGASADPSGPVAQTRNGTLYGTAYGAAGSDGGVFALSEAGISFKHIFDSADGSQPAGGVTLAEDGNLYGVSEYGGGSNDGVLYRLSPTGTYTTLHDFGGSSDGANPGTAPVQASDGNIYGVTFGSFTLAATLYKFTPASGTFATIYTFDQAHGQFPSSLIQGTDGNLYGTAVYGGASSCGTIFEFDLAGTPATVYNFPAGAGGCGPMSLLQATDGNFYGTTESGGRGIGYGTIFKRAATGAVSVIYMLVPGPSLPTNPVGLVQANDGNLYGSAILGGKHSKGALFKVTTSGSFTTLYSFSGAAGAYPTSSPVQDTGGTIYGTCEDGGKSGAGTVYSLNMGLGPFVTFVQPTASVGGTAQILGQGLTGTTSVTFNGIAATSIKVVNDTYITAAVPTGATTGKVVVTTPGGTLTSNVNFRILQ
jgi:uncharacterized repeat protein (TIGR03803 family)